MQISKISHTLNNPQSKINQDFRNSGLICFNGISDEPAKSKLFEPIKKFFSPVKKFLEDVVYTKIAKFLTKIFEIEWVKNLIEKTKHMNLVSHLMTLTSIVLTGFYIKQTLQNKDFDEKNKKTLAINQAIVCLASAIGSYALNGATSKIFDKYVTSKFEAVNIHDPHIKKYVHGFDAAKQVMIFGFIYRFISPVFATPLANYIGNRLHKKKEAELVKRK